MITVKTDTDWSLSDVNGMENQITCYKAQMLPKLKVIGKLIEEISCSPSSPRLEPVKLKPNRTALYGRDLSETCSWISERKISQHCSARINKRCWAGFANCLPHSSTSEALRIHCRNSF